jgi:hypothetical protein
MNDETLAALSMSRMFNGVRYSIPIYQRAYAWTKTEIDTLVDDIRDYCKQDPDSLYYLGTLVVHKSSSSNEVYEVIDGQQRLTTLYLLLAFLQQQKGARIDDEERLFSRDCLDFQCRGLSTQALHDVYDYSERQDSSATVPQDGFDVSSAGSGEIIQGYKDISRKMKEVLTDFADDKFIHYLLNKVMIFRVELPDDTDLNHYFEIMNSRGEQLEKHEVVKAKLLDKLGESKAQRYAFAKIWDACSDMSRYVQSGFSPYERSSLFGEQWNILAQKSFDEIVKVIANEECERGAEADRSVLSILEVGSRNSESVAENGDDDSGRYGTIIDFPNFLLHVLKVFRNDAFSWEDRATGAISLDDKKLIESFDGIADSEVEDFIVLLLRLRHYYDCYVIKTDSYKDNTEDDSNWSLRSAFRYCDGSKKQPRLQASNTFSDTDDGSQAAILNLQAMFQVTDTRHVYKTFLFGILEFLNRTAPGETVDAGQFKDYLIDMAIARHRAITSSTNGGFSSEVTDRGTATHHFVFNYLEFILWYQKDDRLDKKSLRDFRFKYRKSVEHFFPQHPDQSARHGTMDKTVLNCFGNLCLMTKSENSRRSNLMPEAKVKQYDSSKQTLKFQLMAERAKKKWTEVEIEEHDNDMNKLLQEWNGESGSGSQD